MVGISLPSNRIEFRRTSTTTAHRPGLPQSNELRRNQAPERNNTRRVKFTDVNASAREFFNHRFGRKLVICRNERVGAEDRQQRDHLGARSKVADRTARVCATRHLAGFVPCGKRQSIGCELSECGAALLSPGRANHRAQDFVGGPCATVEVTGPNGRLGMTT